MNFGVVAKWLFRRFRSGHPIFCNTSILDEYAKDAPSDQNALDIFEGEWSPYYTELLP